MTPMSLSKIKHSKMSNFVLGSCYLNIAVGGERVEEGEGKND